MRVIFISINKLRMACLGLVLLVTMYGLYFFVSKNVSGIQPVSAPPIYSGSKDIKAVAFTCNVDWGNEYIPDMLQIMNDYGVISTFFITGRWAEKNPELTIEIKNKGHSIGSHGYGHIDHSKLDYQRNVAEIEKGLLALEQVLGIKPELFAPPSGAFNDSTLRAAESLGCKVILWSIDTIDWKRDGVDNIINRVLKKLHNGGIVLMHPTDQTVAALPVIIENIRKRGYNIIPLEDIVNSIDNN
jgi:probable sporulation protein (polysaccharide deacetylase family)